MLRIRRAVPGDEDARLAALREYRILDTTEEQVFDDLTVAAAEICDVPIALLSLVDEHRQWLKSAVGLDVKETPREHAFCSHAIIEQDTFLVPDALADDRFRENPLVTGDPMIRFYAGSPLVDQEGFALGTLCVIDRVPRLLSRGQIAALEALSRSATAAIEARRVARKLAETTEELFAEIEMHRRANHQRDLLAQAIQADGKSLRDVRELLPICSYCKGIRDESGAWQRIESYISDTFGRDLTHGICPGCANREWGMREPE